MTPPGESRLRSYQIMLTAIPTKTAVCKTSVLTPNEIIRFPPGQFLDQAVPGRRDEVPAGEHGAARRRLGVDRLQEFVRRRGLHVRHPVARKPVACRGPYERLRVPTRDDHRAEIELAGHRPGELDASGRAI